MFMQSNNFGSSEGILKQNQLEALKSLSLLLVREINSLDETQANLKKSLESEKPISLFKELQRFEANMIRCALIRSMGKQRTAAKLLGIKETTLSMKIKRFKIDLTELA
jgi:transcriptional regulator with PAS, ATPase and Fis domain